MQEFSTDTNPGWQVQGGFKGLAAGANPSSGNNGGSPNGPTSSSNGPSSSSNGPNSSSQGPSGTKTSSATYVYSSTFKPLLCLITRY